MHNAGKEAFTSNAPEKLGTVRLRQQWKQITFAIINPVRMTYLAPIKPELRRVFARDLPSAHDWFKSPQVV